MPSVTLPCHMSLFHSVPPERHGIVTNIFTPQVRPVQGICERVRAAGKKAALFYDWGELRDLAQPDSLDFGMYISGHTNGFAQAQAKLKETVKSYIRESSPDFVFFYLGLPDEIGHAKGWMKEDYMKAVHDSMETVGEVAGTLPDDYITIITTIHPQKPRRPGRTRLYARHGSAGRHDDPDPVPRQESPAHRFRLRKHS
ncbi:putative uncharacterized protein [Ruminococcus sp. CAG:382]|nr:putative uncharacterized protein [Ruminococcus sp. CAG:382]